MDRVTYLNLPNCFRLSNETVELVVPTEIGPRVLRYALLDGRNLLGEYPELAQSTAWGDWKPWGGHRMWVAPEGMPRSYEPDNHRVQFEIEGDNAIRLIGDVEEHTGLQKELRVELDAKGAGVNLRHRITNRTSSVVELSVWALTIMRGGGAAIVPQEPFHPFPEILQPVRPMALWSYTNLADPRFEFTQDIMRLRSDETRPDSQKIGIGNKRGWCAYQCEEGLFVKRFGYEEGATYPDYGSNNEVYTAGSFIEVESLSPLRTLEKDETAEHWERWEVITEVVTDKELASVLDRRQ